MTAPTWLTERLKPGTPLRPVGPDTFSVLAPEDTGAPYDSRAAAYDRLIGMNLYNRLVWGTSRGDYARFIADACALVVHEDPHPGVVPRCFELGDATIRHRLARIAEQVEKRLTKLRLVHGDRQAMEFGLISGNKLQVKHSRVIDERAHTRFRILDGGSCADQV